MLPTRRFGWSNHLPYSMPHCEAENDPSSASPTNPAGPRSVPCPSHFSVLGFLPYPNLFLSHGVTCSDFFPQKPGEHYPGLSSLEQKSGNSPKSRSVVLASVMPPFEHTRHSSFET